MINHNRSTESASHSLINVVLLFGILCDKIVMVKLQVLRIYVINHGQGRIKKKKKNHGKV